MSMDRLTEQEREFATRWHGVIYAFLNRNRLPEAEYYDVAVFGYLRAVMRYNREPELGRYSFSTVAWKAMLSSVGNKKKSDRLRGARIAYSLNELTEEGSELGDFILDIRDSFMELVQWEEFCGLMRQVMPLLTVRQQGQLALMLEGYRMQEIVKRQHKSIRDYYSDLRKIRETVASVMGRVRYGKSCTGATGPESGKEGGVR